MHTRTDDGWKAPIEPERLRGDKLLDDLVNAATGKTVVEAGRRVTARILKKIGDAGMTEKLIESDKLIGQYAADDMINTETGEVLIEAGGEIEEKTLELMEECGIDRIAVLDIDHINVGAYIRNTIRQDRTASREEALLEIYKVMRPGEPPTVETAGKALLRPVFRQGPAEGGIGRRPCRARRGRRPCRAPETVRHRQRLASGAGGRLAQNHRPCRGPAQRGRRARVGARVGLRHDGLGALRPLRRRPREDGHAAQSRWR